MKTKQEDEQTLTFAELNEHLPSLITLKQANMLMEACTPYGKPCSYGSTQIYIHRHRKELTTPESQTGRKNRIKPYIYKERLIVALRNDYGIPASEVNEKEWITMDFFVSTYKLLLPDASTEPRAILHFLHTHRVPLLYKGKQATAQGRQFVNKAAARAALRR